MTILVDVLILALLAIASYLGYRRGAIRVAADLVGFLIASVIAGLSYQYLGAVIAPRLRVIPTFANLVAFLVIFALAQLIFIAPARYYLCLIPEDVKKSPVNRWLGTVANLIKMTVLVALALVVITGLPVSSSIKELVANANSSRLLLAYSGGIQEQFNSRFGSQISDTLSFFTIKQGSSEVIKLGYTTTKVKPRPDLEDAMLDLVNQERTSQGLRALTMNKTAKAVAREHSRDMFARGYFSHNNPDGLDPFDRMGAGGVIYLAAGENLALAPNLTQAHNGLMNSPGHRENILRPEFGTVGIGVIDGGAYGLMITQNFTN